MKSLISILFIAVLGGLLSLLMTWWSVAIAAFVVALLAKLSPINAFLTGFLAVAILWAGYAFYLDTQNSAMLSSQIASLFSLSEPMLLVAITALLGGLVGGFGALTAAYFRKMLVGK